jgi:lipopolysaccharide export system permease protein
MNDGEVHRKLPNGDVSVIKFDSYAFDLADLTERAGEATIRAKDRDLWFLMNPDPEDDQVKRNPGAFTAELHRRFTEWTLPILFGLVALVGSVDARSHREARVHPMISALLVALAIRWAIFYAGSAAESSLLAIPFMYLIPIGVAALAVRQLSRHKSLELPASWRTRLVDLSDRLTARLPGRAGAAPTSNGPQP